MRLSAAAALALLALSLAVPTSTRAWDVLERFKGDALYMVYDVSYRVSVASAGASGVAISRYALHIVIEKLNRTHYIASALAGDVTYSFTSNDVLFLHLLAPLYIANLSKYFIDLLYVPPSEGVTVNVVLSKESVPLFLNAVARWYKIVEDTSGEVCQEIRVGDVTVRRGVKYKMVSPRAELVYDCQTGVLVSLSAAIYGESVAETNVTMSVELSKLNFLDLTSISPHEEGSEQQGPLYTMPLVLLVSTTAVFVVVLILTLTVMRRLRQLKAVST